MAWLQQLKKQAVSLLKVGLFLYPWQWPYRRSRRSKLRNGLRCPDRQLQSSLQRYRYADCRSKPAYLKREEVPADVLEHEKEVLRQQALNEGKPEKIVEKMIVGRIEKFYKENCLLDQEFIKDSDKTVQQVVNEAIAKIGEKLISAAMPAMNSVKASRSAAMISFLK